MHSLSLQLWFSRISQVCSYKGKGPSLPIVHPLSYHTSVRSTYPQEAMFFHEHPISSCIYRPTCHLVVRSLMWDPNSKHTRRHSKSCLGVFKIPHKIHG